MKHEARLFHPHANAKAPIVSEGRLVKDLSMREWTAKEIEFYDSPTFSRVTAKILRLPVRKTA